LLRRQTLSKTPAPLLAAKNQRFCAEQTIWQSVHVGSAVRVVFGYSALSAGDGTENGRAFYIGHINQIMNINVLILTNNPSSGEILDFEIRLLK
jgi:hypothetical protein